MKLDTTTTPVTERDHVLRVYREIRRKDTALPRVPVTNWPGSPREIFSVDHAKEALRKARARLARICD